MAVKLGIGLPPIDYPRLNLEFVRREPLNAQAIEEPWSVGRHIGRLISPVVVIVVTEQTDVRDKNPGIDVEAVLNVEVISSPCFRNIFVGILEIPLAAPAGVPTRRAGCGATVVAWRGSGK